MDIKDIIIIKNNETKARSWLIAQGFAKEHKKLLQLQVIFEDFGRTCEGSLE